MNMAEDTSTLEEDSETTMVIESGVVERFRDEASERLKAYLIVISGPRVGHMVQLDGETVEIGRATDADLHLKDRGVSRSHALIDQRGDDIVLEDLGSSNGTFVNGDEIDGTRVLDDDDKITLGTATVLKFTYQDEVEETFQREMYEASLRDGLTDAYNKDYLDSYLRSELAFAQRHGTRLSLLMLDIDHFKPINDTHGHLAGDAMLIELVDRLTEAIRVEDMLARYGGDEFAVVSREIGPGEACTQADRIREVVGSEPFNYDELSVDMTISVGVASVTEPPVPSADELIEAADQALYRAKNDGRDAVCSSD